jgi:AraC-like DNA-binding protein
VQHIEFLHKDHFEEKYHRKWLRQEQLASFIDFFWETDFDALWPQYPDGFSDILFPNTGYTYLINLGTPFVMQLGNGPFEMRSDGFLPRHKSLACHHAAGNKIFGIKFKISPLVFEKKINFSEYREYIFPLSYLIDRNVVTKIKEAPSFQKRVELITGYYKKILDRHDGSLKYVSIVAEILRTCYEQNEFDVSIEELAKRNGVSTRTLQRYFESATSISSKQALQIMRIRKAVTHLTESPASFRYTDYGYYDNSHFYKHMKQFFGPELFRQYQLSLQTPGKKNPAAF